MNRTLPILALVTAVTISGFSLVHFSDPAGPELNPSVPADLISHHVVPVNQVHPAHLAIRNIKMQKQQQQQQQDPQQQNQQPVTRPEIQCANNQPVLQVAFVLDCTGSMSGLIHTAKEKIWSIAHSLTQTKPTPKIELALVAYRDRGDAFVTKVTDLSEDIDLVYSDLMSLSADGGGDEPESVNEGLNTAITKIEWDNNPCTYRAVFLVGDCPPHMDYGDDVKYTETCEIARKKGIFVNTIQMGENYGTEAVWSEIASLGHGDYIRVGMDAGGLTFTTPVDDEIAKASIALESTKMYYGTESVKSKMADRTEKSISINSLASPAAAAERATFNTMDAGATNMWGSQELLNSIEEGEIVIEDIPAEHLPDEMKTMDIVEKKDFVNDKLKERERLEAEMKKLIEERDKYINTNIKDSDAKNSINSKIFETVKKQAATNNIAITGNARK